MELFFYNKAIKFWELFVAHKKMSDFERIGVVKLKN